MKTLKLIDRYLRILEQDAQIDASAVEQPDATDINTQPEEQEVRPLSSEGEKYLVNLLVQAFAHTPTDQELNIVDSINQEVGQTNPRDVAETIQQLLNNTQEDFERTIDTIDKQ
jgi:hypothetical protein